MHILGLSRCLRQNGKDQLSMPMFTFLNNLKKVETAQNMSI